MAGIQNPNLEILLLAVHHLEELVDDMVFLGGCATGLLITDKAAPPIRITRDVDAIVQISSRVAYYELSKKLRAKGFAEDHQPGAPICRWNKQGVILDIMPTDPNILGFGNEWYQLATDNAEVITIKNNITIQMVSSVYFMITKIEAFKGRGNNDFLLSHDIEDLIAVIDGRPELLLDVRNSNENVKIALSQELSNFMQEQQFIDSISGHLPTDTASQARIPKIITIINKIIG